MSKRKKNCQEQPQLFKNINSITNLNINTNNKRTIHGSNGTKELLLLNYKISLTKHKLTCLKRRGTTYTDPEEILKIGQQLDKIIEIYRNENKTR